jgi:hypothetical protein
MNVFTGTRSRVTGAVLSMREVVDAIPQKLSS